MEKGLIRIRKGLVVSEEITSCDLRIYQILDAFSENHVVSLGPLQLMKLCNIKSKSTISNSVKRLRTLGLINWKIEKDESGALTSCIYHIKDYRDWVEDSGREDVRGFYDISKEILSDTNLTPSELRLLEAFYFADAAKEPLKITIRELCPLAAMSAPTVLKVLKTLIQKKYITEICPSTYKIPNKR